MPVEYTACVASVIKSGKSKDDAQRICAISFNKKFGISPQAAHKIGDWKGWKKSHGFEESLPQTVTCKSCNKDFDYSTTVEICMGTVKCPNCGMIINQEGTVVIEQDLPKNKVP